MNKAFSLACLMGATAVAHGHHNHNKHHHDKEMNEISNDQNSTVSELAQQPLRNLWTDYWGDISQNALGQAAKCFGCSAAMTGIQKLLEVSFIHNGILDLASAVCIYSGEVGDRFKVCPQLVHQFGEPMYAVVE